MREVAIVGIGQTPINEQWDKSLRELAGEAALNALEDAGIMGVDGVYVGNMLSGSANRQQQLGAFIADWIGMRYRNAAHVESACSLAPPHSVWCDGGCLWINGVVLVSAPKK
jgi:acetyl-CoA C-acetyltransferase